VSRIHGQCCRHGKRMSFGSTGSLPGRASACPGAQAAANRFGGTRRVGQGLFRQTEIADASALRCRRVLRRFGAGTCRPMQRATDSSRRQPSGRYQGESSWRIKTMSDFGCERWRGAGSPGRNHTFRRAADTRRRQASKQRRRVSARSKSWEARGTQVVAFRCDGNVSYILCRLALLRQPRATRTRASGNGRLVGARTSCGNRTCGPTLRCRRGGGST